MNELSKTQLTAQANIHISNISKVFETDDFSTTALKDISLEIFPGDFIAFVGPSGSGKSTLLNIISGLDRPTGGRVEINGIDITLLRDKALAKWRGKHVGLVFQSNNLIPVLTVEQNIELPLILNKIASTKRKKLIREILDKVGLGDKNNHFPNQLSGGEEQRVAIARAVVHEPSIIILDEPTGRLDRENADEILELFHKFNKDQAKTIIMVTHDLKATEYASRILKLDKGSCQ